MFSKSFIILGLLALFACQGTTANQLSEIEKASLGDLIKQVKEIITGLNQLVSGGLKDALNILTNLVTTIVSIKKEFLEDGLELISNGVGNVLEFVANKTAQAAELGIDITKCIVGTNQTLIDLTEGLTANLTDCVTTIASKVLDTVNIEISNINDIIKSILAAPVKLSKCLITLRPISCVSKLLGDLSTMLATLPGQIIKVVEDAVKLVDDLPKVLVGCVTNIGTSVKDKTQAMITEIGNCVDNIISQSTTTSGPVSTTASTTTTAASITTTTAASTTNVPVPRVTIGELVDQVKAIIASLNNLVSGVIGDGLGVLTGLVDTIKEIKEKYLDDGIALITGEIGNVAGFIKDKTEQAIELGVDISQCVIGREEQLQALTTGLVFNLTDCITTTVGKVLTMVIADISNVNNIVSQITGAPVKLTKCLISLRPLSCIQNLISDLTSLLASVPKEIKEIIEHATNLVQTLPVQLGTCIANISEATTAQTSQIIKDVGDCVDNVISGGSF